MKRYEVTIEIDSTEDEDKVQMFLMRSISQAIATSYYNRYNEDTLKLKVKEASVVPKNRVNVPLIGMFLLMLGVILSVYVYQKTQGLF